MRIPVTMHCSQDSQPQPAEESPEQSDLVIDESRQGESDISEENDARQGFTPRNCNLTPTCSSPSDGVMRPSSTTSSGLRPSISYEQLGHGYGKPSPSTLSLLASSKKGQSLGRYHHHPTTSLPRQVGEKEDYSNYSSPTVIHTNGVWTPTLSVASSSTSSSSFGSGGSQQGYEQDYHSHPEGQTSEQIVSATSYLYDMAAVNASTSSNANPHNFHHNNGLQHVYKAEPPSSSRVYHNCSPHDGRDAPIPVEETIKNAFFTQDKVDTLCDVMLRSKNYDMLEQILNDLPKDIHESENVLRARAALAFREGNYPMLFSILESRMFSSRHHRELQDLWKNARYMEAGKVRGRSLGAVDKYRIRRKYSLPRTIWDGDSTSYTFKDKDRKLLIETYQTNQYPNGEIKKELQHLTGLDKKQIDNWFKNRRQRDRPADQKPRKSKHGSRVSTPPSSGDSDGSGVVIYGNMSYPSPTEEESMDVKYIPYGNGSPPDIHHPSPPIPVLPCKIKQSKRKVNMTNSVAWAKETAALVGEKLGKRKRLRSHDLNGDNNNETIGYDGTDYHQEGYGAIRCVKATSVIASVGNASNDNNERNLSALHSPHQQYAGSCYPGFPGMAWSGNWPGSSSGPGGHDNPYSSMTILPSLAASFSHSSHHHAMNVLNAEPRIQVQ